MERAKGPTLSLFLTARGEGIVNVSFFTSVGVAFAKPF